MARTHFQDQYSAGVRALQDQLEKEGVLGPEVLRSSPLHAFLLAQELVLIKREPEDVLESVGVHILDSRAGTHLQGRPEGDSSVFCLAYLRVRWRSRMSEQNLSLAGLLDIEPWVLAHLIRDEANGKPRFSRGGSTTVRMFGSHLYIRRVGTAFSVGKPEVEPMRSTESFVMAGIPLPV
jgi:hypothetical protein